MNALAHPRSLLAFLAAMILLAACEPIPGQGPGQGPGTAPGISATLRIDGDTVQVSGRPAVYGEQIRQGDWVSTGPGSSALIRFSDGTAIQLDERTDPVHFEWFGDRLRLRMDDGAVRADKGSGFSFIDVIGRLADFFSWSSFVVEERRTRFFRVDLFSGRMQLTRPVTGPVQGGGEYFVVYRDRAEVEYGRTAPRLRAELERRFDRWTFTRVERIRVPSVIDMELREAMSTLERAGLQPGSVSGPTRGRARVVAQAPGPRQLVTSGTRVDLTVRAEVSDVRVPNVVRMDLREAQATLEKQGLGIGALTGALRGDRYVVGQRPSAGTTIQRGGRVDLELRAKTVATIPVPELRKRRLRDAIAILERSGLKVGQISGRQIGDAVFVTGQSPAPGTRLPPGSAVNLQVQGVIQ